ncbi:MAG: hypothetical protein EPN72_12010 [Nevskiaceae bacterium]|nr:MAG: hypothetical protein EPN63_00965 [Nevskiaceae bacterium]TBR71912.1 MAG: hypothetical protein EPN72_12010 [Nevskiaceae bacterium]
MIAADSLRFGMSSDAFGRWLSPRRCVCRACACALHVAQHPAAFPHVQTACPGHAMPRAWPALAGGHAACCTAPPVRQRPERQRRSKAQGKIKGRGTPARERRVCTWGWRGTRAGVAVCREEAQYRVRFGESACFARRTALALAGRVP